MSVQIYSRVFKEWQQAEAVGPVRVSSMVTDVDGKIIHTNDYLMCRIPDSKEELGYSQENFIVYINHGKFYMRNLLSGKSLPLYDYRSGMKIIGNVVEGIKLKKV